MKWSIQDILRKKIVFKSHTYIGEAIYYANKFTYIQQKSVPLVCGLGVLWLLLLQVARDAVGVESGFFYLCIYELGKREWPADFFSKAIVTPTCISVHGPSIGRAGRPHRPRCSPHWHLSGEGAVSENRPHSHLSPTLQHGHRPTHPGMLATHGANTWGTGLSPPPLSEAALVTFPMAPFLSPLSSFYRSYQLKPELWATEAISRKDKKGKRLWFSILKN